MPPSYHVYLAKLSTTPDNWDSANDADYNHTNGWIKFTCPALTDSAQNKNTHKHNASHISYRIITGKVTQGMVLTGLTIVNTGDTESSEYYNAVKEFILRHMLTGTATEYAYPLYLHIYSPSLATKYIKWMDDSETMKPHCKVNIKSFSFLLDNSGVYVGTITLEEAWT